MQNLRTLTYSEQKYTYNILDALTATIEVHTNPFDLPFDTLFKMAARINKKRSFLFVSKLLGKHLPINPKKGLLAGEMLAAVYMQNVKGMEITNYNEFRLSLLSDIPVVTGLRCSGSPLIIAFAETATALGHAFFDIFPDADFFHTTREEPLGRTPTITFEEEHSHATAHRCYIPVEMIANEREIILVDDELTTGKTALNIIRSIHSQYKRKEYSVVAILDWRSPNHVAEFDHLEKELGITISVSSILAGQVEINEHKPLSQKYKSNEDLAIYEPQIEYINLSGLTSKMSDSGSLSLPFIKETGRFGLKGADSSTLHDAMKKAGRILSQNRISNRTLVLGTGEFMYIPMRIAAEMGPGVHYHSTTRSPIFIKDEEGYGAQTGFSFPNPEDERVTHFVYNIAPKQYDEIFLFFEREVETAKLEPLLTQLRKTFVRSIKIVFFSEKRVEIMNSTINRPSKIGSYSERDVVFLLKDLSEIHLEDSTDNREKKVQSGEHYSESLPIEYEPPAEYVNLFRSKLHEFKQKVALYIGIVAEQIYQKRQNTVLVSLARAGTPVGILIKRYIEKKYGTIFPHYSISIIRDRGIDENALLYILKHHPSAHIQFVDGWTGKGAISVELKKACRDFHAKYNITLDDGLAVLADPGQCAELYGTREDFLIPSACLNSTVSGLVSRTVLNEKYIGKDDFHGAKYYTHLQNEDLSNEYIDLIENEFPTIFLEAEERWPLKETKEPSHCLQKIQDEFQIGNVHHVKPGVGETTRVLLRRVPWKILMRDPSSPYVQHIIMLANEKGVEIVPYPEMNYLCCGLIRTMKESVQ